MRFLYQSALARALLRVQAQGAARRFIGPISPIRPMKRRRTAPRRNRMADERRLPIGAEFLGGATHFRVWAPRRRRVEVVLEGGAGHELRPEDNGYFSAAV